MAAYSAPAVFLGCDISFFTNEKKLGTFLGSLITEIILKFLFLMSAKFNILCTL